MIFKYLDGKIGSNFSSGKEAFSAGFAIDNDSSGLRVSSSSNAQLAAWVAKICIPIVRIGRC